MGTDASIALSVKDNLSAAIVGMRNSVTNLRSDMVALQGELTRLNSTRVQLRMDMSGAKREAQQAQKAFEALGDSATEAERKAAEADWRKAEENLENIRQQYELVGKQVRQTTRDMEAASGAISRTENRAGGSAAMSGGGSGVLSALGKAGLMNMAGSAASQWGNAIIGSLFGSEGGSIISSGLSGAVQGAAMGSLLGPVGTAIGAAIGGGLGLVTGGGQAFQERDEAFKAYYSDVYDAQSAAVAQNQAAGSVTASQRQLDAIAFDKLIGTGMGAQYLEDLRTLAADTPMEYGDLTAMSRALATGFGDDTARMLNLIRGIGDAGSAVGVSAQDMTYLSQVLSRMESSNRFDRQALDAFQDRGIDVLSMLSGSLGVGQGQIYEMISKGSISGTQAVDIIQNGLAGYAGSMEQMAKTFSGLESTLSDTMTEIYNAGGESYNASRSEAMAQEIEAYGGALGDAMQEAYSAIGAGKAALENLGEAYTRDALSTVLEGSALTQEWDKSTAEQLSGLSADYQAAMADYKAGNEAAGLKIDDIIATAEGLAQQQFEASALYKANQDAEAESLAALRENTSAVRAASEAYGLAQERTKGTARSFAGSGVYGASEYGEDTPAGRIRSINAHRFAVGLDRVPRNDFPALLHEGERVLTAREAERADRGQSAGVQITITGNNFGSEATAEEIAQRLADLIEIKQAAGVYG